MNTKSDNPNNVDAQQPSLIARGSLAAIAITAVFFSGCAMCCGPYDYHYPTFGGIVQRADPVWGRVGSPYSDPGQFGGPSADYNLAPQEYNPTKSDFDDGIDDLEPLDVGDEDLDPIDPPNGGGSDSRNSDSDEVLPPPPENDERPGPDESTSFRRLRNQSRRAFPRWR